MSAYFDFKIINIRFDGSQMHIEATIKNTGDCDGLLTRIYITSMLVCDGNGDPMWFGGVDYKNLQIPIDAGQQVRENFTVNDVDIPYYDGILKWNMQYEFSGINKY